MASLLIRSIAMGSTRFLDHRVASRSFFSWLPGCFQTAGPLQARIAPLLCARALLPFLTSCPLPTLQPVSGLKSKMVLKRRCKDCYFVRRRGRLYVCCKTHPRHKQRQL